MAHLNGWYYRFVEYIYALPEPPKRKRTKPMEVICIGMPRTGTESLQHALIKLGKHYHLMENHLIAAS
jgi:hypothetical protein